ncbi:MAG TPA: serine hydrolase domain-containing protein [Acidimicrobiales bacterium]|nr:serine hydrolase domain-containing protein [Acidimicrobiales bacterium]
MPEMAVPELLARAAREIDEGILPSCQVALARDGELIAFEAFGDTTTDTRYSVFSATKAIVASAAWLLIGEGLLDVGRRVGEYVPEFATNGKEAVTVEQLMLHTGGFPHAAMLPPEWSTREGRLRMFADWKLSFEPGTAFEYHPTSAHWVLAEMIERLGGMDYRDFVQQRITDPVGLPRRVLGLGPDDHNDIALVEMRGDVASGDELEAALGVRELEVGEVTNDALLAFNLPEVRTLGLPGAGGVMRAADLALFYQALLHNPKGIWDDAVLRDATGGVRNRLPDKLFKLPANRTLGLTQAGDDGFAFLRGFGSTVSGRAFGHGGAGGQIAWADPGSGLSFAYVTNGIDANVIRQAKRGIELSSLAGAC